MPRTRPAQPPEFRRQSGARTLATASPFFRRPFGRGRGAYAPRPGRRGPCSDRQLGPSVAQVRVAGDQRARRLEIFTAAHAQRGNDHAAVEVEQREGALDDRSRTTSSLHERAGPTYSIELQSARSEKK